MKTENMLKMPEININPRYWSSDSIYFRKTKDAHGGMSNMSSGYPLKVLADDTIVDIKWSEALYQALRFPNLPDIQKKIIDDKSPMGCKFVIKPHIHLTVDGWGRESNEYGTRLQAMWWTLLVKWFCNKEKFTELLSTDPNKDIVEYSVKDPYWGANMMEDGRFYGANILGQMLKHIQNLINKGYTLNSVPEPEFDAILFGRKIEQFGYDDLLILQEHESNSQLNLF